MRGTLAAWIITWTWVALAACGGDNPEPPEQRGEIGLQGSEAGNPPVADQDTCTDVERCRSNARRFLDALREPWTPAPLSAACVDEEEDSYCECAPTDRGDEESRSLRFEWPERIGDVQDGCLLWSRLATAIPSRRDDPAECLYAQHDPEPCEPDACDAICREVEEAREPDAAVSLDARFRATRCSAGGCTLLFELDGSCYVKPSEFSVTSKGPFDCSLSDDALVAK